MIITVNNLNTVLLGKYKATADGKVSKILEIYRINPMNRSVKFFFTENDYNFFTTDLIPDLLGEGNWRMTLIEKFENQD